MEARVPEATGRFEICPAGSYSFTASVRFLEGFAPAAYEGGGTDHLRLAFVADGGEVVAGVYVYAEGETVVGEVYGEADPGVVRAQVGRILSLDLDGGGFAEVGKRDPVVRRLQERYPGLRTVCFYSPYEAAAWALIGHRIRIVQAAKVKARMARELGPIVEIRGELHHAFPGPSRLVELEDFPGLFGRKAEYLRHLAGKTVEGRLDAAYLRSLPVGEALKELKEMPGIGDFSAELVLLRGVGESDYLPVNEPRLGRAVAMAYGLDRAPATEELEEMADSWRPYRTWVSLHLRTMLEEETGEISGGRRTGSRYSA
jgi:DNA-3-methyladenine glycosylase II